MNSAGHNEDRSSANWLKHDKETLHKENTEGGTIRSELQNKI